MKFTRGASLGWIVALAGATIPSLAAAESPWSITLGPASVDPDVRVTMEMPPGTPLPGASARTTRTRTVVVEVAYEASQRWAIRGATGWPPKTDIYGTGTLAPFGKLASTHFAPGSLTATFDLIDAPDFKVYAGAGVAYMWAGAEKDEALTNFKLHNAWGSVVQIGAAIPVSERISFVVDFKRVFLKTHATGNVPAMGGAPAKANIDLASGVLQAGLSYRF